MRASMIRFLISRIEDVEYERARNAGVCPVFSPVAAGQSLGLSRSDLKRAGLLNKYFRDKEPYKEEE